MIEEVATFIPELAYVEVTDTWYTVEGVRPVNVAEVVVTEEGVVETPLRVYVYVIEGAPPDHETTKLLLVMEEDVKEFGSVFSVIVLIFAACDVKSEPLPEHIDTNDDCRLYDVSVHVIPSDEYIIPPAPPYFVPLATHTEPFHATESHCQCNNELPEVEDIQLIPSVE
jgi:hypothetical protein